MKKIVYLVVCASLLFVSSLRATDVLFIELKGHTTGVIAGAFSLDGKQIGTATEDGIVRLWDATTGEELREFESVASFSLDGKKIVTESGDNIVRIWDVGSGDELHQFEGQFIAFSPDGKKIITGSGEHEERNDGFFQVCRIWNAETGRELRKVDLAGYDVEFSPGGARIVTVGYHYGDFTIRLLDVNSGRVLRKTDGWIAVFSPTESKLITSNDWTNSNLQIWNTATGSELTRTSFQGRPLLGGSILPQNRTGVTQGNDTIWHVAFSPSGTNLLTIGYNYTTQRDFVQIRDTNTGRELQRLTGIPRLLWSASFSPDGRHIVTAGLDGTVQIWNAGSGTLLRRLEGRPVDSSQEEIRHMNPGFPHITVFRPTEEMRGDLSVEHVAMFLPDGRRIVTVNYSEVITRIFDTNMGRELFELEGWFLGFSPDGRKIATVSDDTVRVWTLPTASTSPGTRVDAAQPGSAIGTQPGATVGATPGARPAAPARLLPNLLPRR